MSSGLLYIGEFPPPYGGVTIKNSLLVNEVLNGLSPDCLDLYRFKRGLTAAAGGAVKLAGLLRNADRVAVGVGHPARMCWIFKLAKLLRGEAFLGNITVFMMGVSTPDYLESHPRYIADVSKARCIFTESEKLNKKFAELGCANTRYLPNFRRGDGARDPRPVGETVKFVYFAQVRPEKGFDTLCDACLKLNAEGLEGRYAVSVYGSVLDEYRDEFSASLKAVSNMVYKGAFDAAGNDIYAELNQYDASVSSSSWREGMSGTNIECKFAGVANIVSSAGFNPECVEDGVDGLLVKPRDVDSLTAAMRKCVADHEMLGDMKQASYKSRVRYDVDTWKTEVLEVVTFQS